MGLGIIGAFPPAPSHTVHAVLPHTAFPRAVDDPHSAVPTALASHPSDLNPRPQLTASCRQLGTEAPRPDRRWDPYRTPGYRRFARAGYVVRAHHRSYHLR